MNKYKIIWDIQYFFLKILHLKFYAKQNYPPINNGYESLHLKNPDNYYFYGTTTEFENFHHKLYKKNK